MASLLFVFSGCSTTWVQKSPEWEPIKSTKVLLGHYSVQSDVGISLVDLAKEAGGGVSFDEMSLETYMLMEKSLEKFNFSLTTDKKRTEKVERVNVENVLGSICLNCQWTHPEGAKFSFTRILNSSDFSKEVANDFKGDDKEEVFLSANLQLRSESAYWLWDRFVVILSIKILNQNGDAVFQARAQGLTDLSFIGNPIGEGRIEKALSNALAEMNQVEVENEISTLTTL